MLRGTVIAAVLLAANAPAAEPVRAAAEKALPLLLKAADGHMAERTCFACHNQALPILAYTLARDRGLSVPDWDLSEQLDFIAAFLGGNRDQYRKGNGQGGQADTAGYALLTLELGGYKPDETTEAVVEYLIRRDAKLDHWRSSGNRPPSEVSDFSPTYLAVRALKKWANPDQGERAGKRIAAAREWLLKTPAKDTEDRVFRLLALQAVGADIQSTADELIKTQRTDGGWAQTNTMESDAYATGSALFALHETGRGSNPSYGRGVDFLLKTQLPDGSWHVRTHSKPVQGYFESGFPHEKDQFISAAASGWAAAALVLALPPTPHHQVIVTGKAAGGYAAFPDICRTTSGDLLCVFYSGSGHVTKASQDWPNGGRIMAVRSSDDGKTWSEPAVLFDTPFDDRDPSVACLRDGTLLCNWFVTPGPRGPHGVYLARSTDDGKTWSAP
ncbi:MAG TPA: prenyltransferase/squalene oxidase repeat-containing protein, partial [Gemmataceae bacterium]|nr:prenyltransferase/squalene oxidase repeat-containing protein [Gemmataceae bacterium]